MVTKTVVIFFLVAILMMPVWAQDKPEKSEQNFKKCPQCNYLEKRQEAQFCIHCGEKLTAVRTIVVFICPQCHKLLDKGASYCAFCGKKGQESYQEIPEENYKPIQEKPDEFNKPDKTEKTTFVPPAIPYESPKRNIERKMDYIYPQSKLLQQEAIDEGLRHTSQQRDITYSIYTTFDDYEKVEDFYQNHPLKFTLMKYTEEVLKTLSYIWKYKSQDGKVQIEVVFYSFAPAETSQWDARYKKILERMNEELKPLRIIEKEIKEVQELIAKGKGDKEQLQSRIDDLNRRYHVSANSRTYWQLKAQEQLCLLKSSILLISVVKNKEK